MMGVRCLLDKCIKSYFEYNRLRVGAHRDAPLRYPDSVDLSLNIHNSKVFS